MPDYGDMFGSYKDEDGLTHPYPYSQGNYIMGTDQERQVHLISISKLDVGASFKVKGFIELVGKINRQGVMTFNRSSKNVEFRDFTPLELVEKGDEDIFARHRDSTLFRLPNTTLVTI